MKYLNDSFGFLIEKTLNLFWTNESIKLKASIWQMILGGDALFELFKCFSQQLFHDIENSKSALKTKRIKKRQK